MVKHQGVEFLAALQLNHNYLLSIAKLKDASQTLWEGPRCMDRIAGRQSLPDCSRDDVARDVEIQSGYRRVSVVKEDNEVPVSERSGVPSQVWKTEG